MEQPYEAVMAVLQDGWTDAVAAISRRRFGSPSGVG